MSKTNPRPSSHREQPPDVDRTRQLLLDSVKKAAFVLGTALVVFTAARNSVTWHLQRFWGASGDYWQRLWEHIREWAGGDDLSFGFWGTILVATGSYWFFNLFLMVLDSYSWPQFLLKYKVQEDKNVPLDPAKLHKAIKVAIINQTLVGMPVVYLALKVMIWRGCSFGIEVPTFHWVLFELLIFTLVEELMFYYSHRLLHHPRLYRYIHKMHHEWTAPIGLVSIYAHPIEHIISNVVPPLMGPILMGSHIATAWLWFILALFSTTVAHCGYHFPLLPSPEAHDFHHLKFNNNFGVLGVLDRLHGTDANFRASRAYERHIMLLGTVPMSQQVPDDAKKKRMSVSDED